MDHYNSENTPIVTGTQLSNSDKGGDINTTLYKKLIGSLMYLTTTRPNIMYVVSLLSMFMESLKDTHWKVGKCILRYIEGLVNEGICYTSFENDCLIGYTNNDFARSIDDQKHTYGYVFFIGSNLISWKSKKTHILLYPQQKQNMLQRILRPVKQFG